MKPFFTYYGGKWRAALGYPSPLGVVIEPFAGAAGYSVRWGVKRAVLIDLDERVCGVWDYLIRASEADVRGLPLSVEHVDGLVGVCDEAKWLIGFWLNKGCAAPCKSPSAWMREGLRPNSFWGEVIRERIASQLSGVRGWSIRRGSYLDAEGLEGTWFVDPPYERAGVHYPSGAKGIDFEALGSWCRGRRGRRGQVIVCEQEGASWLPFRPHATIKANESRSGGKVSREVVWTKAWG